MLPQQVGMNPGAEVWALPGTTSFYLQSKLLFLPLAEECLHFFLISRPAAAVGAAQRNLPVTHSPHQRGSMSVVDFSC